MKKLLNLKQSFFAYVANREFGYSMEKIGKMMDVSQSTISNAIRDVENELRIRSLENELHEARSKLMELGYENSSRIIEIKPNI